MYIIAGKYKNRKLSTPKGLNTRPTASHARAALFNICQNSIENATFLDIFAGSGAIGLEALSRGAKHVTFIENDKEALKSISKNIELLGVQASCQILAGDSFKMLQFLEKSKKSFDIIFADPPYYKEGDLKHLSKSLIEYIDLSNLLLESGTLFIEESFEHQPVFDNLKSLNLKNTRRISSAALQQYVKNC